MMAVLHFVLTVTVGVPPPRVVDALSVRGSSLCLDNGDGTHVLVDAPGPEWRWLTYQGEQTWFAVHKVNGQWTDHLYLERLGSMLTIEAFGERVKAEYSPTGEIGRRAAPHTTSLESSELSDAPEAGSMRVVLAMRYNNGLFVRMACYLTPRRYILRGPLGSSRVAARFASYLASYRVQDGPCSQEAPQNNEMQRTKPAQAMELRR